MSCSQKDRQVKPEIQNNTGNMTHPKDCVSPTIECKAIETDKMPDDLKKSASINYQEFPHNDKQAYEFNRDLIGKPTAPRGSH